MIENTLVSVIIPVYNEAGTILEILRRVRAAAFRKEIIIVDDYSTDGTTEILRGEPDVVYLRNEFNPGKGSAVRTGIKVASGEVIIIQDADLEYDPGEIPRIVRPIIEGRAEVSYGSRFLRGMPEKMALLNKIANQLLVWVVRILFGTRLSDEATCYKAFRGDLLKSLDLRCERFEFCPEVTARLLKGGHKIHEVEIFNYRPRNREKGKKIRWSDGVEAVYTLFKYRFTD
ncbi:MAG: glycosyltransferase family 2 protein [Candidatus Krumholzibacteriota bacterium]|nr:glycosyltransferase family 2 protein [Candidatus Krumholzibacteriota bacterium]